MSSLVVGTLPQTRALLRRLRRSEGGGTVHFPTCEKALRTLRVHRTVLDHAYIEPHPPSTRFNELVQWLRTQDASLPITLMTADADATVRLYGIFERSASQRRLLRCIPTHPHLAPCAGGGQVVLDYQLECQPKEKRGE